MVAYGPDSKPFSETQKETNILLKILRLRFEAQRLAKGRQMNYPETGLVFISFCPTVSLANSIASCRPS